MVKGRRWLLAAAVFLLVLAACTSTARRPGPGTDRDLFPQEIERLPAYPAHDGLYLPVARGRLPHAWIEDEDGGRRPVKDLVAPGRFLLIAGEDGQAWCEAARQLAAEAGVPLDALRIGHIDGDYHDPRCAWQRHRQIARDGAILIRPDRFIAWRSPAGSGEPRAALAAALSQILARPVDAPVASAV
jgi:2,4-dichlorophenol 6-monooxygenase